MYSSIEKKDLQHLALEAAFYSLDIDSLKLELSKAGSIVFQIGGNLLDILIKKRPCDEFSTLLCGATQEEINNPDIEKEYTAIGVCVYRKFKKDEASRLKQMACFELLLEFGVKPTESNIINTINLKQLECLKMLIKYGATINEDQIIQLEYNSDLQALSFLMEKGLYDVNGLNKGLPKICYAAMGNNAPLVNFLLCNGADPQLKVTEDMLFDPVFNDVKTFIVNKNPIELCFFPSKLIEAEPTAFGPYALEESRQTALDTYQFFKPIEVKKNADVLGNLQNDPNSWFSKLPQEYLVQIASLMGDNPNVIEEDKEAYELAYENFFSK